MPPKNLLYFADPIGLTLFIHIIIYQRINENFNQVIELMTGVPMQNSKPTMSGCFGVQIAHLVLKSNFNGVALDFV